jgi:hypothetical protein
MDQARWRARRWWLGLTVGLVVGAGVLIAGTVVAVIGAGAGLLLLAREPHRDASVGGLSCGFGGAWLVLFGRVQLTCGDGCGPTDLAPWLAFAVAMLLIGIALTSRVVGARSRRPT